MVKIAILSLFPGLGRNQWSWFWVFWAEWFEHGDVGDVAISCMDVDVVTAWPFPRSEGKSSFAADHWVQNVCAATFWVLDPDIWTNAGRFPLAHPMTNDPVFYFVNLPSRRILVFKWSLLPSKVTFVPPKMWMQWRGYSFELLFGSSILQILFGGAGGTLVTKTSPFRLGTLFL